MEEKIISSVFIDQKDLSTLAQSRTLNIEGDVGSVFTVNVIMILIQKALQKNLLLKII